MHQMPELYLRPIVHFVSSPCGRGKTYAACKFFAYLVDSHSH